MSKRRFVDCMASDEESEDEEPVYYGPELNGWMGIEKDRDYESRDPTTGKLQKVCECNIFCYGFKWHDIREFAPSATHSKQKRDEFDTACVDLEKASKCRDGVVWEAARNTLWTNSAKFCQQVRDYKNEKLNESKEPCRLMLKKIHADMHAKGGCKREGCDYNGPSLEIDHKTRNDKTEDISDLCYWASNGGPEAMWKEYTEKCQCRCRCCHTLEPTSNTGKRKTSMAQVYAMPTGKSKGTPGQIYEYGAKCKATINTEKYLFVDKLKRKAGCCVKCKKKVTAGYGTSTLTEADPRSFDANHIDERTKYRRLPKGVGGVAEICHDVSIRLDKPHKANGGKTGRELIVREWKLTEVLCCNCHSEHSKARASEMAGDASAAAPSL